jgi:uncharacterized protein YjbJ (UPF0337 family)
VIEDWAIEARPWGFSLEEIRVPVRIWHGDCDTWMGTENATCTRRGLGTGPRNRLKHQQAALSQDGAGDDGRAASRNVLGAQHVHPKPKPRQRHEERSNEGIQRLGHSLLAREKMSLLVRHTGQAIGVSGRTKRVSDPRMSIFDKITGRAKKAAGDITGDGSMRAQGSREERKGEEKEKLAEAQDRVEEKSQDVADLERRT